MFLLTSLFHSLPALSEFDWIILIKTEEIIAASFFPLFSQLLQSSSGKSSENVNTLSESAGSDTERHQATTAGGWVKVKTHSSSDSQWSVMQLSCGHVINHMCVKPIRNILWAKRWTDTFLKSWMCQGNINRLIQSCLYIYRLWNKSNSLVNIYDTPTESCHPTLWVWSFCASFGSLFCFCHETVLAPRGCFQVQQAGQTLISLQQFTVRDLQVNTAEDLAAEETDIHLWRWWRPKQSWKRV